MIEEINGSWYFTYGDPNALAYSRPYPSRESAEVAAMYHAVMGREPAPYELPAKWPAEKDL